jgi:hypothetical protein
MLSIEQELRESLTIDLSTAAKAAGIGRGLAYRLANQGAELVPGVPLAHGSQVRRPDAPVAVGARS